MVSRLIFQEFVSNELFFMVSRSIFQGFVINGHGNEVDHLKTKVIAD